MTIIAHIHSVSRAAIGVSASAELASISPNAEPNSPFFEADLPLDDHRAARIFDMLRKANLRPWTPDVPGSELRVGKYYRLQLERRYDATDLEKFRLFEFRLPSEAYHLQLHRGENGQLCVPLPPSPTDLDTTTWEIMCGDGSLNRWYFVPRHVRDILISAGLRDVLLDEAATVFGEPSSIHEARLDARAVGGPFWELGTTFVMPPVSPLMDLVDNQRRQAWPGMPTGLSRREGLYMWPELHYRDSDLRAVGPFDIARTFENFGWSGQERMPDLSPIVVSKRFYDVCREHGFKVDWLPVHVDPI